MSQQMKRRAKTNGQKGKGGQAFHGLKPKQCQPNPIPEAEMNPVPMTWSLCDEGFLPEPSPQTSGEEDFPDSYIECVITSQCSEPNLEDFLPRSLENISKYAEEGLSQQDFATSSLIECSLEYRQNGTRQKPMPQLVEGDSNLGHTEYLVGEKLPAGGAPGIDLLNRKQLGESAERKSQQDKDHGAPEALDCPHSGCTKKLRDKKALQSHRRVHAPRAYVCAECGRAFQENSKLARHFLMHTGEKPFLCTYAGCGKRFSLDFNLRTHVRIHTGEKRFSCPFPGCKERFVKSTSLKIHMVTHGEEKKPLEKKPRTRVLQ